MKTKLLLLTYVLSIGLSFSQSPFGTKQSISTNTGSLPYVIDSKDLNNDTFIDIVIGTVGGQTIEWYKNDGDGNFTLQSLISSSFSNIGGLVIADVDGDKYNDIVATSSLDNKLVYFKNDGNGNFGSEQVIATGLTRANTVKVADMDKNGTLDIVVGVYGLDLVQWYPNNLNGSFGSPKIICNLSNYKPLDFDLGDCDNDGDTDVVVAFDSTYMIKLFKNNLTGNTDVSFTQAANNVSISDFQLIKVEFGDIDNNGDLEILKVDKLKNPAWYNLESDGTFSEHIFSSSDTDPTFAKVSDLNDDSLNDVVIGYSSSNPSDKLGYYKNSDFSTEFTIDNTQNDIYSFTINDFDNDGDLDMASISTSENDLNWFKNTTYSKSLSNSDFANKQISVYPNPVSNILYFKNILNKEFIVSVYNILGKKVLHSNIGVNSPYLDVRNLKNGIYIIDFENYNTTYKFVKL